MICTFQVHHFELQIFSSIVIPCAEQHVDPDLAYGLTRNAWHNAMESCPCSLEHVLRDNQLAHCIRIHDVNATAIVNQYLGEPLVHLGGARWLYADGNHVGER